MNILLVIKTDFWQKFHFIRLLKKSFIKFSVYTCDQILG